MPASTNISTLEGGTSRWWPEALLASLASLIFLGALGSVELWGKREQRASLEAVDTVENRHWLVAEVQGHPRLEKPPLSRWAIASVMAMTGRRDEWIVRLPSAFAALAMTGLVYGLGRRIAGRSVGLASALILCSTAFFVAEMRQAGNDGLLALFTTLALYAAWRRLEQENRAWVFLFYLALGLGGLAKGPIILLLVGLALVPYLAIVGNLGGGIRRFADGWGIFLLLAVGLSWPLLVLLNDPNALGIWSLEMGQKTGLSQVMEHRRHSLLAKEWPGMILPWPMIALLALALPFLRGTVPTGEGTFERRSSPLWFPWCWAVTNLAMFCLWRVAKPSYYLPCLPGMAILLGAAWVHACRFARLPGRPGTAARSALQLQWVILFVGAILAPPVTRQFLAPSVWPWTTLLSAVAVAAVVASAVFWRRGADALSLSPLAFSSAAVVLVGYGIIAPSENADRGHRELARAVEGIVPSRQSKVLFLQDIDEGLAFYLRGHQPEPVPGCERRYNAAFDYVDDFRNKRRDPLTRNEVENLVPDQLKRSLIAWLDRGEAGPDYLLVPNKFYDRFAAELSPRMTPVFRESNKKRGELTLLRIESTAADPVATLPGVTAPVRR